MNGKVNKVPFGVNKVSFGVNKVLFVDDLRCPPMSNNFVMMARSVNSAIELIEQEEEKGKPFDILDLDHDAGIYASDGGDYIRILDWLEESGRNNYKIMIHSMNVVGVENMINICKKNGWKYLVRIL